LVTQREKATASAGRAAKAAIHALPDSHFESPFHRVVLLRAIDAATLPPASAQDWPGGYAMISLAQIGRVWDAIRELPARDRPSDVRRAFDLVLLNIVPGEGRINLTRDEFAERMGVRPHVASSALGVLVRLRVLHREVMRVPGLRGPGVAVFHINPNVAWNGPLDVRKAEAAKRPLPLLKLMQQSDSV